MTNGTIFISRRVVAPERPERDMAGRSASVDHGDLPPRLTAILSPRTRPSSLFDGHSLSINLSSPTRSSVIASKADLTQKQSALETRRIRGYPQFKSFHAATLDDPSLFEPQQSVWT
jgi:hypothetical protein